MQTWKYIDNQFEVNTKSSYKKALILSNYHDAALQAQSAANPTLLPLYTRYHPLHLAYVDQYNSWKKAGGAQQGQTLNLEQQLDIAYTNLDDWDVQVQVVYKKTTPEYKSIFPDGRKPFTKGGIDGRINAYDTLGKSMDGDAALAAIKTQVDTAFATLDTARDTQEGAKSTKTGSSQQVDIARAAAMNMQYRNMGFIIDNFFDSRVMECNSLFNLQTLRESDQSIFTGTLELNETEAVLIHTFAANDELRLKIDTNGPINFFLASTPGGTDSNPVTLNSAAEITTIIDAFGAKDLPLHRFLTAVNNSGVITKYRVQLL